ncbi:MAG: SDR family NAD(P)-dependent oxidoreductase, partial [Pseudomonadales bacterium]
CDLSLAEGPAQLIAKVAELDTPIDILINNAGVAYSGAFESLKPDEVKNLVALNLNALVTLTHHYLPAMIERGSGRILNVASVAGFQPIPSMSLYAASKAFVLSLTEGLSEELRGTGVSITALCPGLTRTEMVAASSPENRPLFMMSSVEDVAREGYEALMAREVIRIPGIANQAAVTWAKFQPRWLVRGLGGLYARLNSQKR